MKKIILGLVAVGAAMLTLSSCDSRKKLSDSVAGIWAGTPEMVPNADAERTTVTRLLEFVPSATAPGEGKVIMTAYITVDNTVPSNDSIVTPLTVSASGTATISGVYQAKDDDEMVVVLDASTLNVEVDPEGVQLNYDVLTQQDASVVDTLRPAMAARAKIQMSAIAQNLYMGINEIDDIKVKDGTTMKCEIKDVDYTFSLQTPAVK